MLNKMNQKHKRKLLCVLKLTLVLVLGHAIIRTAVTPQKVREAMKPKSAGGNEMAIPVAPGSGPSNAAADYSAVLERDLFGGRDAALRAGESASRNVSNSLLPAKNELGMALLGTVAGSPAVSMAVIKDLQTNVVDRYRTGDKVLAASIESIERDRIVLIHRGQRKVLALHAPESVAVAGGRPAETTVRASTARAVQVAKAPTTARTFTDRLRNAMMKLPEATVEPHSVGGEVEGLKISDLGDLGEVGDIGLKDGDVIRAINGHRLNSKQKAFQIAMKARSQAALSVELERDDKIKKFSLPLK